MREEIESGKVKLAGWVDHNDVPAELNRMRLLVMPSQPTEGLPTTILESLACGTSVYATPVSGIPDVVKEGETGFVMDGTDPDAIRDDVTSIIEHDDLTEVSETGRELVESTYGFEAAVRRYRGIFRNL